MDKLSNLNFVLPVKYLDRPEHRIAVCVTTVQVSRNVLNNVPVHNHTDHVLVSFINKPYISFPSEMSFFFCKNQQNCHYEMLVVAQPNHDLETALYFEVNFQDLAS